MSLQKFQETIWFLVEKHPEYGKNPQESTHIEVKHLRNAIIYTKCNTESSIKHTIKVLKEIKWLKGKGKALYLTPLGKENRL